MRSHESDVIPGRELCEQKPSGIYRRELLKELLKVANALESRADEHDVEFVARNTFSKTKPFILKQSTPSHTHIRVLNDDIAAKRLH